MIRKFIQFSIMFTSIHAPIQLLDVFSSSVSAEDTCDSAIEFMKNDVYQRIGGSISSIDISKAYNSPFNNANEVVWVGLGDRANRSRNVASYNISNSPVLLREYAGKIITGCSKVIKVTFGEANTDVNTGGWYLGVDNQIRREKCVDLPGRNGPDLPWGKTYCM